MNLPFVPMVARRGRGRERARGQEGRGNERGGRKAASANEREESEGAKSALCPNHREWVMTMCVDLAGRRKETRRNALL